MISVRRLGLVLFVWGTEQCDFMNAGLGKKLSLGISKDPWPVYFLASVGRTKRQDKRRRNLSRNEAGGLPEVGLVR